MSLSETCKEVGVARIILTTPTPDPVLSDCPDFHSLAPPTKTRLLSLKRGRGEREEEEDEEDQTRDLRMCSSCHRLIHRSALPVTT